MKRVRTATLFLVGLGVLGWWSIALGQRGGKPQQEVSVFRPPHIERLLTQFEDQPSVAPTTGCVGGVCVQLVYTLDEYMTALPSSGLVKFTVNTISRDGGDETEQEPFLYLITTGGKINLGTMRQDTTKTEPASTPSTDFDQFFGGGQAEQATAEQSNEVNQQEATCVDVSLWGSARCCLITRSDEYICFCCDDISSSVAGMSCACLTA